MPKFLLLRFSSIGDIVLTSPVVRWLHQQVPNAEIHYLTKRSFVSLVAHHPHIAKVYGFDKTEATLSSLLPALKAEQYDHILDLHKNLRSFRLRSSLGVPTLTFDKLNLQKWLLTRFKIDHLPRIHLVDRYAAMVAPLGIVPDDEGLDLYLPPAAWVPLEQVHPCLSEHPYIALAVGAAHATKCIPVEQLKALCGFLVGHTVLLLGGPADVATAEAITEVGEHVYSACGQWNLLESASLIARASVVITPDTGLMHMAAAFKRPIVSVWGSTVPALGMYPYLPNDGPPSTLVEHTDLGCRPCSKIGYPRCPKEHFACMRTLDMAHVAHVALQRLPPLPSSS